MQILVILGIVVGLYLVWKYWALSAGAGYDPTPMDKVYKMLKLARVGPDDVIYDLGCGDGRFLITAAKRFGARAVGIEIDPFRFLFTKFLVMISGHRNKIEVRFGNFFKKDISEATVVITFLYGPTNNKLKEKFLHELRPGTRVISYIWRFDDWEEEESLVEEQIYLYLIKGQEP